ncbi:hypothetical protein D3C71_1850340 [compost metagenome]
MRGFDVGKGVLAANAGKADDRRNVVEGVEETVGRQIAHASTAQAGDPANRTWADNRVERVVRQAVALARIVAVEWHGFAIKK